MLEGTINAIKRRLTELERKAASAIVDLALLDGRLTTAETDITSLEGSKVDRVGDTMTGPLTIQTTAGAAGLKLQSSGTVGQGGELWIEGEGANTDWIIDNSVGDLRVIRGGGGVVAYVDDADNTVRDADGSVWVRYGSFSYYGPFALNPMNVANPHVQSVVTLTGLEPTDMIIVQMAGYVTPTVMGQGYRAVIKFNGVAALGITHVPQQALGVTTYYNHSSMRTAQTSSVNISCEALEWFGSAGASQFEVRVLVLKAGA